MNITELNQLLELSSKHPSGYLELKNYRTNWRLIFTRNHFLYAIDERHSVRRWHRLLKRYFPTYHWKVDAEDLSNQCPWQIHLLDKGLENQKLSTVRAKLMLRTLLHECLFELSFCGRLEHNWQSAQRPISRACQDALLSDCEIEVIFNRVKRMQESWQAAGLLNINPVLSPTLKKEVKASQLPAYLPVEHAYLRGDFTLWEIAGQLNKPPDVIAASLLPLVQSGTLEFLPIPDFSLSSDVSVVPDIVPNVPPNQTSVAVQIAQSNAAIQAADVTPKIWPLACVPHLIACIDDSPVLGYSLKKMLSLAGYRTLIIQEPMHGFSQLIEHKPDLILLDLMLPNANGYSVCKFLRNTPVFKETPIVILTGKNKPIDRARARASGATEFLAKPPQQHQLIKLIQHHLGADMCAASYT